MRHHGNKRKSCARRADGVLGRDNLTMGFTGVNLGYAPDKMAAARGAYAADVVPMICGMLPFESIHENQVEALLYLEAAVQGNID